MEYFEDVLNRSNGSMESLIVRSKAGTKKTDGFNAISLLMGKAVENNKAQKD